MSKVATRYARALAISTEPSKLALLKTELSAVAAASMADDIQAFFARPDIATKDKEQILDSLTDKLSTSIINLLKTLVQNNRFSELAEIATIFKQLADAASGQLAATIETPMKLTGETTEKITAALKKLSNKNILLREVVNKDLLGGLKIRFGDEVIDLSLAGQLNKLTQVLS